MSDSMTTMLGIGSLLSIESATKTFQPQNFRLGHVPGWERTFSLAAPMCVPRGGNLATGEIACLAARPIACAKRRAAAPPMAVSVFELDAEETAKYYGREYGYNFTQVEYVEADGTVKTGQIPALTTEKAWLAAHPEMKERLAAIKKEWPEVFYHWEAPDAAPEGLPLLLPPRYYLKICRTGAEELGCADSYLDTTFLYDGRSVREYLADAPDVEEETRAVCKARS
ncbi:hypothetical protein DIPPA_11806 [Diplonema papillatum]|nr:hypothetical protein DIPPA_24444 [Diplonema papillatum]KAJ9442724.1 hypothetical protein DIPPA_11806 [Diplonema papillatum]